jgi:hypothetical protein
VLTPVNVLSREKQLGVVREVTDIVAENWDTLEAIPPRDQWKNSNGKF